MHCTYHGEGGGEEAESVHDMVRHPGIADASDVLADVLSRRHQHGGHEEEQKCDAIVQPEGPIVDEKLLWLEFEICFDLRECVQHYAVFCGVRS